MPVRQEKTHMRLSVDQIKQGLLHPEWGVREMSLIYFQQSFSADAGVMPCVIEAVEKYGWDEAYFPYYGHEPLVQTDATVAWLIDQLKRTNADREDEKLWKCWMRFLSRQLSGAPTEHLARYESTLGDLPGLDSGHLNVITQRLELASTEPEDAWREMESYCDTAFLDPIDYADDEIQRYAELIARGGDQFAERVLDTLDEEMAGDYEDPKYWVQAVATRAAGMMRLASAIPRLFERLIEDLEDGGEWYCYRCVDALVEIGSDDVIQTVANRYWNMRWEQRAVCCELFTGIHSELTVKTGVDIFARETSDPLRGSLAHGLLQQFDSDVVEPIRDFILRGKAHEEEDALIRGLISVAALLNISFPELEPWRARAAESTHSDRLAKEARLTYDGRMPDDDEADLDTYMEDAKYLDDDDEEFEGEAWDDEEEDEEWEDDESASGEDDPAQQPIKYTGPKVGRNELCPCGSGKKFKKCCMNRQQPPVDW